MNINLPGARAQLVGASGEASRAFYVFFQSVATNLQALSLRLDDVSVAPPADDTTAQRLRTTDDLPEGRYNWYSREPVVVDATTARTASMGDNRKVIQGTNDAGLAITVPAGAFDPNAILYALQGAASPVQFVPGTGVTFLPADSAQTRDVGSVIGLKQTSPDVWEPLGDLAYFFPAATVHANPTAASAQPLAFAATADKQVLKRVGTTLQWVQQVAGDVTFTPAGNLASTDVQAALVELDTEKVDKAQLASEAGAGMVGNTPAGGITSVKVQDALNELDTKKATVGGAETFAVAAGTADALTAAFTPAITAPVDGEQIKVRAAAANATTAPTLKVDALAALPITKFGGKPLAAGDIYGAGHELILRYVVATPAWELANPAASGPGGGGGPGIALSGRVDTYVDLPATLTAADAGKAYLVDADKLVYVWDGTAFPASGAGASVDGVQSVTGTAVDNTDPLNPVINSTGGGAYVGAKAYCDGTQAIAAGKSTAVSFNTSQWDTGGILNTAVNPTRITFPVAGKWRINFHVGFPTGTDGKQAFIRKNGSAANMIGSLAPAGQNGPGQRVSALVISDVFASGDYIELFVYSDAAVSIGGSVASSSAPIAFMEVEYLGA